ncbi:MAG: malto-oligosyltrehalose synthase, partial [Nitrospirales bacterium]|nr:malto-oligosyltrehalose synthase [Nitrospirales bacterium]
MVCTGAGREGYDRAVLAVTRGAGIRGCAIERQNHEGARIPLSTYRLQFNHRFTFRDAAKIIPYLHDIGISDIYASPYFKSQPGSLHGYDIVDPGELNPEVGTGEDYDEMIRVLHRQEMGQVLDIVPNHMCITSRQNAWWWDVLENGPGSRFAGFFDVDWNPLKKELRDKILLPFLGDQYGKVLERQDLKLVFEEGSFFILYFEHTFPLAPKSYGMVLEYRIEELRGRLPGDDPHYIELLSILTALGHLPHFTERESEKVAERYREKEIVKKRLWSLCTESREIREFIGENVRLFNGVRGEPKSFDLLDALLAEQPYRLSHWRVALDEINYRRFFDINQIAAIRMENPPTFRETHALVFSLIREGKVTGLRVDHPDGLLDPADYFRRLQKGCFLSLLGADPFTENAEPGDEPEALREYRGKIGANPSFKAFYIVGEKILTKGERMPEDWPIFSTTGYVFMNSINGIFVDMVNGKAMDGIYAKFTGIRAVFPDIVYEKKKLIMQVAMASEVNTLGSYLSSLADRDRHTRDFTLNSLTAAIVEVIAFFPVYRTYSNGSGVNDTDRKYIELSIAKAKRKNPATSAFIYDFLRDVLLLRYPPDADEVLKRDWLSFVMRFQQITGPVMAKGLEDTAFYVYNRLVSLNEVGGSPDRFGIPLETFHGQNIERSKFWPHALIATSTHDAKRGEDVRARINVLSEIPDEWRSRLTGWRRFNKKKKIQVEGRAVPEPNEEYLFYQTLVGAWPLTLPGGADYE